MRRQSALGLRLAFVVGMPCTVAMAALSERLLSLMFHAQKIWSKPAICQPERWTPCLRWPGPAAQDVRAVIFLNHTLIASGPCVRRYHQYAAEWVFVHKFTGLKAEPVIFLEAHAGLGAW